MTSSPCARGRGKASAALIDAVFLDAFAVSRGHPDRRALIALAAANDRIHHRLVRVNRFVPCGSIATSPSTDGQRSSVMVLALAALSCLRHRRGLAITSSAKLSPTCPRLPRCRGDDRDRDTKSSAEAQPTALCDDAASESFLLAATGANLSSAAIAFSSPAPLPITDAVMLARATSLSSDLKSDTAPLNELVEALFSAAPSTAGFETRPVFGRLQQLAHDTGLPSC